MVIAPNGQATTQLWQPMQRPPSASTFSAPMLSAPVGQAPTQGAFSH